MKNANFLIVSVCFFISWIGWSFIREREMNFYDYVVASLVSVIVGMGVYILNLKNKKQR